MITTTTFTFTRTKETTDEESKRAEDRASQANQSLMDLIQTVFRDVVGSKFPSAPRTPVADEPEEVDDIPEDLGKRVRTFIVDNCTVGEDMEVNSSVLYKAYKSWSKLNGSPYLSSRNFAVALGNLCFDRKHTKSGTVYVGIGLLEQEEGQDL
jgi:hypothetical protein